MDFLDHLASIEKQVTRLLDIEVKEVSVVDRAANKRRFLIVKREDDMPDPIGKEVKEDGQGNLSTEEDKMEEEDEKKADAPLHAKLAGEAIDSLIMKVTGLREKLTSGMATLEEINDLSSAFWPLMDSLRSAAVVIAKADVEKADMEIPKPVKEAVLRTATEAMERLLSAVNGLKEAQTNDEQSDAPLPEEYTKEFSAIAGLLSGISEKYPSPKSAACGDKEKAKKGDAEKSDAMEKVIDKLDAISKKVDSALSSVKKVDEEEEKKGDSKEEKGGEGEEEEKPKAEEGKKPEGDGEAKEVEKALAKRDKEITDLREQVAKQAEKITALEEADIAPNSSAPEGVAKMEEEDPCWRSDMADESEVDADVSFD